MDIYIYIYILKKKNYTRILDTLIIEDFIEILEQYFHY